MPPKQDYLHLPFLLNECIYLFFYRQNRYATTQSSLQAAIYIDLFIASWYSNDCVYYILCMHKSS